MASKSELPCPSKTVADAPSGPLPRAESPAADAPATSAPSEASGAPERAEGPLCTSDEIEWFSTATDVAWEEAAT